MLNKNAETPTTSLLNLPELHLVDNESIYSAGESLLAAPWTYSVQDKVVIVGELGLLNTSRALRILADILRCSQPSMSVDVHIEKDELASSYSDVVKHGGSVINAAAEAVALMPIAGAFELLESLALDRKLSAETRAGVVWGLRLLRSSGAVSLMVTNLFDDDENVRIAAIDGLEHRLRQDPLSILGSNREQLISASVALYLCGHSCVGRRAALRLMKIVDADAVFTQAGRYLDESNDVSALHRAVELVVLITGEVAELFLVDLLVRLDLPESLYPSIGKILSRSEYSSVKEELHLMKSRGSWWESIVCLVSPTANKAFKLRASVLADIVATRPTFA